MDNNIFAKYYAGKLPISLGSRVCINGLLKLAHGP